MSSSPSFLRIVKENRRRVLGAAGALTALVGASWTAVAQSGALNATKSVPMVTGAAPSGEMPVSLNDLPGLVSQFGQQRAAAALSSTSTSSVASGPGRVSARAAGDGRSGFNLVEQDLTPQTASDEREPVLAPGGGRIAFASNRVSATNTTKGSLYHIYVGNITAVVNADGTRSRQITSVRQVTGLNTSPTGDSTRSQRQPFWSPDGNRIVYLDGNGETAQIRSVNLLSTTLANSQLTNFSANKKRPVYSSDGASVIFSADKDPNNAANFPGQFDIFTINANGGAAQRLTGGANDVPGQTANDWNATFGTTFSTTYIFFSSNRTSGGGRRIWRMLTDGSSKQQVTDPTKRSAGVATDSDDYPTFGASTNNFDRILAFQSDSLLDSTDTTRDLNIWSISSPTFSEQFGNIASVTTNVLSSPANRAASELATSSNVPVDTLPDVDPSFAVPTEQSLDAVELVFATQRQREQTPDGRLVNESGSYDIVTTQARDFTPPILLPLSEGGAIFPVLAPRDDSPLLNAPRTPAGGLGPGGSTKIAFVLSDTEGGVASATVQYYRAADPYSGQIGGDEPPPEGEEPENPTSLYPPTSSVNDFPQPRANRQRFNVFVDKVNDDLDVRLAREINPVDDFFDRNGDGDFNREIVRGENGDIISDIANTEDDFVFDGEIPLALNQQIFDDGPVSQGGHERQANARAGDGIYYCEASFTTPNGSGDDYYINIVANDRSGNSFTYDNVWGFSTKAFAKSGPRSNLFVSDYTAGQRFPGVSQVEGGVTDLRFFGMDPVESYYLTNPEGRVLKVTRNTNGGITKIEELSDEDKRKVEFGRFDSSDDSFDLSRTDVWRTLSRGAVPAEIYDAYAPRTTLQVDPTDVDPETGQPFTASTRRVAVAESAIFWAAPYAGRVFTGPGTILDPATQRNLTNYLERGGRLFLTGNDVLRALTNSGGTANTFVSQELGASFSGEVAVNELDGGPAELIYNPARPLLYQAFNSTAILGGQEDIQIPIRDNNQGRYTDAAFNHSPLGNEPPGFRMDTFQPTPGDNTTLETAYTAGGGTVGQTIVRRNRQNGFESRAIFLSFGLEAINRRYRKPDDTYRFYTLEQRSVMLTNANIFLRTISLAGVVTNARTNEPVPNFLVVISSNGVFNANRALNPATDYLARTDAQGRYRVDGLPTAGYTVSPFYDTEDFPTVNQGFIGGSPVENIPIPVDGLIDGINLRVSPLLPGSVEGRVFSTQGTDVTTDDAPVVDLPVLVRSIDESPIFNNNAGGFFARIVTTNADGRFSVGDVPSNVPLRVILNPTEADTQAVDLDLDLDNDGDSERQSAFLRRVLPDDNSDGEEAETDSEDTVRAILAPPSGTFFLNDTISAGPAGAEDNGEPLRLSPFVVTGQVELSLGAVEPDLVPAEEVLDEDDVTVQLFSGATPVAGEVQIEQNATGVRYIIRNFDGDATNLSVQVTLAKPIGGLTLEPQVATVAEDGTVETITFSLADISGVVVADGQPIVGANVTLLQNGVPVDYNGAAEGGTRTVKTGSDGTFTLLNVAPGVYDVRAELSSGANSTRRVTVPDPASGVIQITPAFDFSDSVLQIQGAVTIDGSAASGATVKLERANNGTFVLVDTKTTGTNGVFAFNQLDEATYRITATTTVSNGIGSETITVSDSETVVLSNDNSDETVLIDLSPARLSGRITLNNTGAAGAEVRLFREENGVFVGRGFRTADSSGNYAFQNPLTPGATYRVEVRATRNSVTVTDERIFVIAAATDDSTQNFALGANATSVNGVVRLNNQAVQSATLTLQRRNAGGSFETVTTTQTNASGAYLIEGLTPGSYQVTASVSRNAGSFSETRTFEIGNPAGAARTQNFDFSSRNASGRVTLNGAGQANVQVRLFRQSGNDFVAAGTTTTNSAGNFSLADLSVGTYRADVTLTANGLTFTESRSLTVTGQGVTPSTITFAFVEATVSGRVTAVGQGVAGIRVRLLNTSGGTVRETTTGANGAFSFANVASGSYRIRVFGTALGTSYDNVFPASGFYEVNAPNFSVGELSLVDSGVTGRVVVSNLTSVGIPGATVELLSNRRRSFSPRRLVQSDDNGQFFFGDVEDGRYFVRAEVVLGGRRYRSSTIRTDVTNGSANVTVPLRVSVVRGQVVVNGVARSGAEVELLDSRGRTLRSPITTQTDANGNFLLFGVRGSRFIARATFGGLSGQKEVRVSRGVGEARIEITAPEVRGRVRLSRGGVATPLADATVVILNLNNRVVFGPVQTDAGGNFSAINLAPGSYVIRITKVVDGQSLSESFVIRQGLGLEEPVLQLTFPGSGSSSASGASASAGASGGQVSVRRS